MPFLHNHHFPGRRQRRHAPLHNNHGSNANMKLLWIEDFLALADSGSFSRAAALRYVTQPAFSRRIRALESWLGVELVDRRSQPLRLTPAAQRHIPEFRGLLRDINHLRSSLQSEKAGAVRVMLATQHSLTMTRLPALLECFSGGAAPRIEFTVRSENHDECVVLFMRGEVDLLLSMEDPNDPLCRQIPADRRLSLGQETLVPLSVPGKNGRPLHAPKPGRPLKLLAFPPGSYLGRIMYAQCFNLLFQTCNVQIVHESVFLAGVKEMLLAGLGMAWLPQSLVERELATGSLVPQDDTLPRMALNVSLYRGEHGSAPQTIDRIWRTLAQANH
jgi:DNA-binding transcriptional LysR family regulator